MTDTKKSPHDEALFSMLVTANDGESQVEDLEPFPGEGIYRLTVDDHHANDLNGTLNVAFQVAEVIDGNSDSAKGAVLRTTFWLNSKAALSRTANGLNLALRGEWMKTPPSLSVLEEWIQDFLKADEWICQRTFRRGRDGRVFANDRFFTPERHAKIQAAKDDVEPTPAEVTEALSS